MNAPTPPLADELRAALAWWEMAGVDHDFSDDATDWLGTDEAVPSAEDAQGEDRLADKAGKDAPQENLRRPAQTIERVDLLGESPPETLEQFREWWLTAPGLDAIGPRGRIAPRGSSSPALMVLVTDPEESDREELLSGPQGQLLDNMLRAMGIDSDSVYLASALPRHTPMADTANLAASGMDAVALHHVGLVSPQKLLVLGKSVLPLIGLDGSSPDQYLREINQNSRSTPVMMCEGLESLLTMPRLKARFWRRWIEWAVEN